MPPIVHRRPNCLSAAKPPRRAAVRSGPRDAEQPDQQVRMYELIQQIAQQHENSRRPPLPCRQPQPAESPRRGRMASAKRSVIRPPTIQYRPRNVSRRAVPRPATMTASASSSHESTDCAQRPQPRKRRAPGVRGSFGCSVPRGRGRDVHRSSCLPPRERHQHQTATCIIRSGSSGSRPGTVTGGATFTFPGDYPTGSRRGCSQRFATRGGIAVTARMRSTTRRHTGQKSPAAGPWV